MSISRRIEPIAITLGWATAAIVAGLATALFTPPTVVGVSGTAAAAITARWPHAGVAILLLIVPLQRTASSSLSVWGTNTSRLIVLFVFLGWLAGFWLTDARIDWDGVALVLALHILVLGSTFLVAKDLSSASAEVYRWAVSLPAYLLAFNVIRSDRRRNLALIAIAGAVVILSLVSFWQVLTGAGPPSFELRGLKRAYGSFGQPNPLAAYFEMTVPLLLAVAVGPVLRDGNLRSWKARPWLGAFAVIGGLGTIALLLTQSRGGILGIMAGLTVMAVLLGGWSRRVALTGCSVLLLIVLITPSGWRAIEAATSVVREDRYVQVTPGNFAVEERVAHWHAAINMAEAHPWLGVGAGNFNEHFREYTPDWRFRVTRGHAHNAYLHELAEAGLIGLTTFVLLFSVAIYRLAKVYRTEMPDDSHYFAIGAIGVTAAVVVHNGFDYLHGLSLGLQLAVIWAMASALIAKPSASRIP